MARSQGRKANTPKQKPKLQEFYAYGNRVYKPQKASGGMSLGLVVCTVNSEDVAVTIANALNAKKARRIIRKLLKAFEPGSALEEEYLADIIEAERYLKKGE